MRRLLPLVLVLGACLEYEITIVTAVDPEGKAHRTLTIHCKERKNPPPTWTRLKPPGDPYEMTGTDQEGFVASARLRPGTHASGLRVVLAAVEGDYGGAEGVKDLPCAEGTVHLATMDLLIGTLVRYEEHVAIGTDPARFRAELPKWLDAALRVLVEALRLKFPEIDFAAAEQRARAELLPDLERTAWGLYHGVSVAMANLRPLAPGRSEKEIGAELWAIAARELASLGIDAGAPTNDGDELERRARAAAEKLAERFLAPLAAEPRGRVMEALFTEDALDDALGEAGEKLFPGDDAQEKLQRDLLAFAASGLGAYVTYGFFDTFNLRVRVDMPGQVLRTNGDLGRLPAVEWRLTNESDLLVVPPVLYAYSFVPAEKLLAGRFELAALVGIEEALRELEPDARGALGDAVRKSLTAGWLDEPPLDGDAAAVYGKIREAVAAATTKRG